MTKNFFSAFSASIPMGEIASKAGLSYLSAATAMRLAGRPQVEFVDFNGAPHLSCLNGALVAVDLLVSAPEAGLKQRMWLPVMDQDNRAISADKMSLCDVNNSRQRCLVKAIAAVFGNGLSLYMNCDGDGAKAAKILGVTPESDLSTVEPVVALLQEDNAAYIEWNVALAACQITDPTFHWAVLSWNDKPYREVMGAVLVDVQTTYKGKSQVLSLPVMDGAFNPIPADKVSAFDWNKTVMRALTKCIAFNTGYGIRVYAEELGTNASVKIDGGDKFNEKAAGKKAKADAAKTAESKPAAKEATKESVKPAETPVDTPVETPAETPVAAAEASATPPAPEVKAEEAKAPETKAEAKVEEKVPEFLIKFRGVIEKRRETGPVGVIGLFDLLAASKIYQAEEKPVCLGVLVSAAASLVTKAEIKELVAKIGAYRGMEQVAADSLDLIGGKLVALSLAEGCAAGDGELLQSAEALVAAGIAKDLADVQRLAVLGKVPAETIDLLLAVVDAK